MSGTLCRFSFPKGTNGTDVERAVADAIFVAECLHGTAKVRLGTSYYLAPGGRHCVIDTGTEIGEQVAQLVTGLLARKLGETAFRVERIANHETATVPC